MTATRQLRGLGELEAPDLYPSRCIIPARKMGYRCKGQPTWSLCPLSPSRPGYAYLGA